MEYNNLHDDTIFSVSNLLTVEECNNIIKNIGIIDKFIKHFRKKKLYWVKSIKSELKNTTKNNDF